MLLVHRCHRPLILQSSQLLQWTDSLPRSGCLSADAHLAWDSQRWSSNKSDGKPPEEPKEPSRAAEELYKQYQASLGRLAGDAVN